MAGIQKSRSVVSVAACRAATLTALLLCSAALGAAEQQPASQVTPERVATLMAEAPLMPEVAMSPDGAWVAYTVTRGSVEQNRVTSELWLQRLNEGSKPPVKVAESIGDTANKFVPRWIRQRGAITYFDPGAPPAKPRAFVQYDVATGALTQLAIKSTAQGCTPQNIVGGDYRWSPQGTYIAFTGIASTVGGLDPRRGVSVSAQWRMPGAMRRALFILNAATGVIESCSNAKLHVAFFDWAPNGTDLVVAATEDAEGIPLMRTDLFIISRSNDTVRPLVVQPGLDGGPSWSPDGKWIAFTSHFGSPSYYSGDPAVIAASGGEVIRLGSAEGPKLSIENQIFWGRDAQSFYFSSGHHMTLRLFRAEIKARRLTPLSTDETFFASSFSANTDGNLLAYAQETLTRPPELFVQALPRGKPRQITHLSDHFPLTPRVRMETVSWPSSDGKFTIPGVLLKPASAAGPLPTLVFVVGGPSMVRRAFAQDGRGGAMLPLAALGYAVLSPNTRGRGGYGETFQRGIRDGRSSAQLPFQDVLDGVKQLVRGGVADPEALGIYGHSYGGYLAAYAVTQTDMFKAAVVAEGYVGGSGSFLYAAPGTDGALLSQDLVGLRDPYSAPDNATIVAESVLLNANRIKTPTLLLFGGKSPLTDSQGIPFFGALQRFKIPSELVVYDEGHSFERPAALADSTVRTVEWMRRWIH